MHSKVNELISSWFEPKPPEPPIQYNDAPSPKGAWRWHFDIHRGWQGTGEWRPLEWDTDEAANSRLLDKLLEDGLCLLRVGRSYVICWPKAFQNGFCVQSEAIDNDRKTAIVMAFTRRKGLTVDDREGL